MGRDDDYDGGDGGDAVFIRGGSEKINIIIWNNFFTFLFFFNFFYFF
jgi:hypothetical protein